MQINDGDTVLVRLTVRDGAPMLGPNIRLAVRNYDPGSETTLLKRDDIVSVEVKPEPLKVGDRVANKARTETGEIIAIADGRAWVRSAPRKHVTLHLSDLTRAIRTNRDVLRETYPDQFARICEIAKEQGTTDKLDKPATERCAGFVLASVMIWADTREGHCYWADLAHAHGW